MPNSIKYLLSLCLLSLTLTVQAQLQYGFRAGLNFSGIEAMQEINPTDQTTLDDYLNSRGFHLGIAFGYELLDFLSLRAELLYNQKGYSYGYSGQSYQIFTANNGNEVLTRGDKRFALNISNAYIDIPVSVSLRPIEKLELNVGAGIGFLINSIGSGEIEYSNFGSNEETITWILDHNYFRDEARGAEVSSEENILIGNNVVALPISTGAYYDYAETSGKYFNAININLHAEIAYFLNSSVFLSGRLFYGVSDITNDFYSVNRFDLDENDNTIENPQKNTSLSTQISLGFYF